MSRRILSLLFVAGLLVAGLVLGCKQQETAPSNPLSQQPGLHPNAVQAVKETPEQIAARKARDEQYRKRMLSLPKGSGK